MHEPTLPHRHDPLGRASCALPRDSTGCRSFYGAGKPHVELDRLGEAGGSESRSCPGSNAPTTVAGTRPDSAA